MAKIKLNDMIIKVDWSDEGKIRAVIDNVDEIKPSEVERMNDNLELLVRMYIPQASLFGFSATNAVATFLANGFGESAEIVEYDQTNQGQEYIY